MKKIFKLSSLAILAVAFMAVKCGEEELVPPDHLDPITVTLQEAIDNDTLLDLTIQISDSMFFSDPAGTQFNSSGSNAGGSKEIKNCNGDGGIVVFTSTDREFAFEEIPTKMGPIVGILSEYQGVRQLLLRSIDDVSQMTIDKCEEKTVTVTIEQFNTGDYEGQLVKIENVQFKIDGEDPQFNGTTSNGGGSRTLQDCDGNELTVFTDKDSPLSTIEIPTENGTIIGDASSFGDTKQLVLRSTADFEGMTEARCEVTTPSTTCGIEPTTTYFGDDFESASFTSGGWTTQVVTGPADWSVDNAGAGNSFYAKMSNYNGAGNDASETWLISPAVDISSSTAPLLSFMNAYNYDGAAIEVYVSTDYQTDSLPSTATWTALAPELAAGNWEWKCSTDLDLSAHKSATTRVAFKYTGSASDGSTWEIDDVLIKE